MVVPLHPKKEEDSHLLSGECPVYGDLVHLVTNREDDQQLTILFTSILDKGAGWRSRRRADSLWWQA